MKAEQLKLGDAFRPSTVQRGDAKGVRQGRDAAAGVAAHQTQVADALERPSNRQVAVGVIRDIAPLKTEDFSVAL